MDVLITCLRYQVEKAFPSAMTMTQKILLFFYTVPFPFPIREILSRKGAEMCCHCTEPRRRLARFIMILTLCDVPSSSIYLTNSPWEVEETTCNVPKVAGWLPAHVSGNKIGDGRSSSTKMEAPTMEEGGHVNVSTMLATSVEINSRESRTAELVHGC